MNLRTIAKVILGLVIILIISLSIVGWKLTSETVTPLKTLNPTSSGPKVLVVYTPGLSDFEQKTVDGFTQGLVAANWIVDIVTASSQAPTNLGTYSLLVVSSPIYGGQPAQPLQDYLARLGDLKGLKFFCLLTGAGSGKVAEEALTKLVENHGGVFAGKLTLFTQSPNLPVNGVSDPVQIASSVAQNLTK